MSLVPHTIIALQLNQADATATGKQVIIGATCSMFSQPSDSVVLLYDDAAGSNGSTAKTTGALGSVVVYVPQGNYRERVNTSDKFVTVAIDSPIDFDTFANLQLATNTQDYQKFTVRERANAQYILQPSGYTALTGDATFANGRVAQLQVNVGTQITTTQLIASTAVYPVDTVINTIGYQNIFDNGRAQWAQNGVTGQAVSQSPSQLGNALINDGNGNQWALVKNGILNVRALGAVGGGVIDDYLPFLSAITSMAAGSALFIPDGVYRISQNLVIDKTIKVQMESSDLNSRLLFNTFIPRTVQTAATHPDDGLDAPISAAITIAAAGVELENIVVDLYVDYTDPSPTNYGTDIDIGILVLSKSRLIMSKCRTRGYWRVAGVFGDCTGPNETLDRMSMYDCRFQGFWSMWLQGPKVKIGETEILLGDTRGGGGASDFNILRVWFGGFQHHSDVRRSDTDGGPLKIDGKLYPGVSVINALQGRLWLNCRFDGADRYMLKLENCIRDKFISCFVDRKTGIKKVDGITGVGTADCLLSIAAGTQNAKFIATSVFNTTIDINAAAKVRFIGCDDENLDPIGAVSFLPALQFGTGIAYNSRSGSYFIEENRMHFRLQMDLSAIGTSDTSQVSITGMPAGINFEYLSATVTAGSSTAFIAPETVVVGVNASNILTLSKAAGGTFKYTDCNAAGLIYITGVAYT